jgi:peptidoglycan/LPS O-acetylase OafA/YrhL
MGRIRELDSLRGLAAIVILIYHLRPGGLVPMGWAAVDLFFVLSGYLITSIILAHVGTAGFFAAFAVRRGLRIWPPYYLTLAALVLVDRTIGERLSPGYLPAFLSFTQGLPWPGEGPSGHPGYFGHTWTLAMEEQFYLAWPLLLALLGRRAAAPLAVGMLVLAVAARACGITPFVLAGRCDGFAAGALLAVVLADRGRVERNARAFRRGFGVVFVVTLAYVAAREAGPHLGLPAPPGSTLSGLNLMFAGAVGLVVCLAGLPVMGVLRWRPLVAAGQVSYGLYLYHALVYYLVFRAGDRLGLGVPTIRDGLALAATAGVAALSWRYLERPLLAFKDRFPYRAESVNPPAQPRIEGLPAA